MALLARLEIRIPPHVVDEIRLMAAQRDVAVAQMTRFLLQEAVKTAKRNELRRRTRKDRVHKVLSTDRRTITAYTELGIPRDE